MPPFAVEPPPRLVGAVPGFNIVYYLWGYYRVPQSLGAVDIRAMTPEQTEAVGVFYTYRDASDGIRSVGIRGKLLIRANAVRAMKGREKISREEAESKLRGQVLISEREIVDAMVAL